MKLTYNSIALHEFGDVLISSQSSAGDPEEAPQRWKHSLAVRLNFKQATYADNFALLTQVEEALLQQEGVLLLKDDNDNKRYQPVRAHRELLAGRNSVRGKFLGNPLATVSARRTALLVAFDQMTDEIKNGKDGTFVFGSINQLVRVDNFSADVDQAQNHIAWSLTMSFTEFPNEAGYAQAEFAVKTREDLEAGKVL